jgi:outer membrane immunogenic protein
VGWGWGRNNYRESSANTTTVTPIGSSASTTSTFRSASSSVDTSGGLFGGQVGCNYQFAGNWVVGVQGDAAGADINGKGSDPLGIGNSIVAVKTDWLASVTARLGVTAFDNQALFYVKGGGAWDHNQWDLSRAANFYNPALFSETRSGWTIGGGAEWVLWSPHWTAFVEYNHYDFRGGGHTVRGAVTTTTTTSTATTTSTTNNSFTTGKQTIEAVKVGVNYKFGP